MINLSYLKRRLFEYFELYRLKKRVSIEHDVTPPLHFVISPGRSGTTLLRKHLLEKTNIHIPPESASFLIDTAKLYVKSPGWDEFVNKAIDIFYDLGINDYWKLNLEDLKVTLQYLEPYQRSYAGLIFHIYKFHGQIYNPEATIFADKTPFLSQDLRWLNLLYPNSKYLFLFRNPYDTIFSRMRNFDETIDQATNRWVWAANEYHKYREKIEFKLIFYEDLVDNFRVELNEVTSFFEGRSLFTRRKVDLGEEDLKHHNRLSQSISAPKQYYFTQNQMIMLSSKLQSIKAEELIQKYKIFDEVD